MYVCDKHLRDILPQINFREEDGAEPFQPDEQVQPASIDLRLSAVFWKPIRRFAIDLRRPRLLEVQPRRYYRKVILRPGETIVIGPRQLLLGRTAEEFFMPNNYAGELVGRSSFARIGLMVSASGGYINPGWRGRMPLQLVNFSPNPIRIVAGLPICQIRFVQLTAPAERPYGHPALGSIYLDDDGGPSYWWRDKRIKRLHELLAERAVDLRIQRHLDSVIGPREPEVIERLEAYVARTRVAEMANAETLLDDFSHREERRRSIRRWAINLARGSFTLGITGSLFVANKLPPIQWWHWAVWVSALGLISLSVYAFRTEVGDHFGLTERRSSRGAGDVA